MAGEGDGIPPHDRYLDSLFGEGGYLSRAFPTYRPRPGQIALAEAVDRAIVSRGHVLAEAGTGVGKSLGYAGPASYHAWATGRPVVIVTANIALQEQIVEKDLPLLHSVAPWPFTFALLKGRNNYLCVDRFYRYLADKPRSPPADARPEERRQLPILEQWARDCIRATPEQESGDVSELAFEPLPQLWKQFSVAASECKRGRCKFRRECFALEATERAKRANVIVTNYHMLYAHVAAYLETGLDLVLGPFEVCILDEAHKAADIARDVFGFKVTGETLRRIDRAVAKLDEEVGTRLQETGGDFLLWMLELAKNRDRYKTHVTGDFTPDEDRAWLDLHGALSDAEAVFDAYEAALHQQIGQLKESSIITREIAEAIEEANDELGDLEIAHARAMTVHAQLGRMMKPRDYAHEVFFFEIDQRNRLALCTKLIAASDVLTPGLFQKRVAPPRPAAQTELSETGRPPEGPRVAVVATSATLATGDGFDYVAGELGVPPGYESLVASSPFDWPNQCLFICPEGMPEPNAPEFKDAVAAVVERVVRLARGRTLGLFTSRRVLEHTYEKLAPSCVAQGYALLKQGDAPRTTLLERFKQDISSVLLGTESFWAGVDVPGESLSVVVIDRLPFPTPDDPILAAIEARDKEWFQHYSIPRAMIAFKQGFGRLVRSLECRGVVVCCDHRITAKRYGKKFLRAMPPVPKSTRLDAIAEWLGLPLPEDVSLPAPAILAPATPPAPPPPQLALFAGGATPAAPRPAPPAPTPPATLAADWDDVFAAPSAPELPAGWDDVELPPATRRPSPAPAWDEL